LLRQETDVDVETRPTHPLNPATPTAPTADPPVRRLARGTTAIEPGPAPAGTTTGGMWREPWTQTWRRRAISLPAMYLATALYLTLLPLLLLHAVLSDAVHRRPWLLCRFHLSICSTFVWHCIGVTSLFVWWLGALIVRPRDFRNWNRALEAWWAYKVVGIAERFYGMKVVIEDDHVVSPGPVILLSRHASILDTILPLRVFGRGHKMIMRIVMKRELAWDPCVDVMAHRMPRTFVRRGSNAPERELEAIRAVLDGMDHRDAVVIFPEGTRFSPEKQAEVLAKLHARHPEAAARAERLRNVLPPRPAGTLAVIDARPDMDVVFCAHTGLEGANKLEDFVNGSLLGRTLRVKYWRVAASDIPRDRDHQIAWLHSWWERIDQWVEEHREN
jgi:1-acyl-sn-glycerol-3-phosphate acyltransferase